MKFFKFVNKKNNETEQVFMDTDKRVEDILIKSKDLIKWENHLNEKALYLYKDTTGYVYVVKNRGNAYLGYYTHKGFVKIDNYATINLSKVKEIILKNINKRVDALEIRKEALLQSCKILINA